MIKTICLLTLFMFVAAVRANAQDNAGEEPSKSSPANVSASEDETGTDVPAALNFTLKSIAGEEVNLAKYKGNVVVIVNTASKCGMTPQYKQLQELHEKYADQGVKVLGFPCNQFGGQEPGTEEDIQEFCTKNYGVTFDMFSKIDVNGDQATDLYKFLKAQETQPTGAGDVRWNFEKFILDQDGNLIARFGSRVKPDSDEFMAVVKKAIGE